MWNGVRHWNRLGYIESETFSLDPLTPLLIFYADWAPDDPLKYYWQSLPLDVQTY